MDQQLLYITVIKLDDIDVTIRSTDTMDSLVLAFKDSDDSVTNIYMNRDEMSLLILKMEEMMDYIERFKNYK